MFLKGITEMVSKQLHTGRFHTVIYKQLVLMLKVYLTKNSKLSMTNGFLKYTLNLQCNTLLQSFYPNTNKVQSAYKDISFFPWSYSMHLSATLENTHISPFFWPTKKCPHTSQGLHLLMTVERLFNLYFMDPKCKTTTVTISATPNLFQC